MCTTTAATRWPSRKGRSLHDRAEDRPSAAAGEKPPREPNETWDAGERLFGLEELLLQMPPIRKLHLERGRLKDLVRLYPDMKREFAAPELLPQAVIATAMVRRRMELLLFRSDDQREAGYALVTVCSPYGYVLVHMLTIYPFLRRQLLGRVAAELVARCYAGKKGRALLPEPHVRGAGRA